jgi:hypothetical protein
VAKVGQFQGTLATTLCGTSAAGDVEGLVRLRRAGDAVVVLDADGWLDKTLTTAARAR